MTQWINALQALCELRGKLTRAAKAPKPTIEPSTEVVQALVTPVTDKQALEQLPQELEDLAVLSHDQLAAL